MSIFRVSLIVVFFLPLVLAGQAVYHGQVRDVATQRSIMGVEVSLLGEASATTTNYFGDFVLKNGAADTVVPAPRTYRFLNNTVIWSGEIDLSLELYGMDGRLLRRVANLGASGSYLLPTLPFGVYLLRLGDAEGMDTYKLFSNGERMSVADRAAVRHHSTVALRADTLLLTKTGYYPRKIALTGRDTLLTVWMLKRENDELHYFNELIGPVAFDLVSSMPSRTNDGGVAAVKIIDNRRDGLMYYMNTKRYPLHYTFARAQLDFRGSNGVFNLTQYRENEDRYLYPANLNHYRDQDIYVLHFVAANEMSCENIRLLYDKIIATSYLEGKLFLLANRPAFNECDVPVITPEELYAGQNYQALNLTENYGYLTKVALDELEDTYLGRRDIVLLDGIPNDVSVVAGIITTEFQTPLSHVNVLSHNRGTPNMALRNGWDHPTLETLQDRLVYLRVAADTFELRPADLAEANAFWAAREPQDTIVLAKDVTTQGLIDLETADHTFVDVIGGKAANFAEMLNVSVGGVRVPTPESSFGIPFYYYDQHLKAEGLDFFIDEMLANEQFNADPAYRRARLKDLRERIEDQPVDPELLELIAARIQYFAGFSAFRFRSSTNAEDLADFSGAGLYSSYSAKADDPDKTIEHAVSKVWASLWNWRAFEERAYYKIDHRSCAMGILVHRSFPDEDANGVVVTRNLYNGNPGFIVNAQYGEESIVFPEPGVLHDQLILFTWSVVPGQNFMIEYLTFSNVPELNGNSVLTDEELFELGAFCQALTAHFYRETAHGCQCPQSEFALDIEFKIDSRVSERKLYLKQARIYR